MRWEPYARRIAAAVLVSILMLAQPSLPIVLRECSTPRTRTFNRFLSLPPIARDSPPPLRLYANPLRLGPFPNTQGAGTWLVNEISCPELEELLEAFESMATVVKFANVSLEGGDIDLAEQNYVDALILFKKLRNDRGVSACLLHHKNRAKGLSALTFCMRSRVQSQGQSCARIICGRHQFS